jgi:DNA-binding response OmpR family regulator
MAHILIVDDDILYLKMVKDSLKSEGYQVTTESSGQKAIQFIADKKPDLVLLDVILNQELGLDIIRKIRQFSRVPVIMVSGRRTAEEDLVLGLDVGADDYLFKPFSLTELLARIRAILRRINTSHRDPDDSTLVNGALTINFAKAEVWKDGRIISLSSTEYRLLLILAQNIGQVISPEKLLTTVWGKEYEQEKEILWVSIARLRQKLEDDTRSPEFIITKTGLGYIMPVIQP